MKNVKTCTFKIIGGNSGFLTAVEEDAEIPFKMERIYYIYGVPSDIERGFHSHKELEQILICVNGSVKIRVQTDKEAEEHVLDKPNKGLYIGKMVWREMFDFSPDSVLLVVASKKYSEDDYIRSKSEYIELARTYFKEEN